MVRFQISDNQFLRVVPDGRKWRSEKVSVFGKEHCDGRCWRDDAFVAILYMLTEVTESVVNSGMVLTEEELRRRFDYEPMAIAELIAPTVLMDRHDVIAEFIRGYTRGSLAIKEYAEAENKHPRNDPRRPVQITRDFQAFHLGWKFAVKLDDSVTQRC